MKSIKNSLFILFLGLLLVGCSSGASLQTYFVDKQETKNFISQDIPLSMVKVDQSKFNEEQKEAYNSVSRLNFLGYKVDEKNIDSYNAEVETVKAILDQPKYKELMEFNDKGTKVVVKYIGSDEDADEVVLFGSSKTMGFAVVRLLGNDMSPDKMMTLMQAMQTSDMDGSQIKDIMNFFN
ncbi:DUF4252 domain-containing protein [Gaetbulibacter aestuarii]|uniref:DUF4252 domain-containing protein n=1 Tax=Gaetbulibacter aestuarii TaxID=1502358 RepID=A0ABW7MYP4_9FLAO